jgi:DNA phosphorothioation-dependent restriction protein DptF
MGEAGAIVGGHIDRNELRQKLYVPTEEDEAVTQFFVDGYEEDGRFLIITGSAGDGKSALLSRAYKQALEAGNPVEEAHIHMDATAAVRKHETYDRTLKRFLDRCKNYQNSGGGPRTGLAINLGLAIDFFDRKGKSSEFPDIWDAIDSVRTQRENITDQFHVINLGHRQLYSVRPGKLGEGLLRDIVEKFAFDDPESPFHDAYQREMDMCPADDRCPLHFNADQFTNEHVREKITKLIAATGVVENAYLNPRSILDYVSSMILPSPLQRVDDLGECPVGEVVDDADFGPESLLWNTVFQQLSGPDNNQSGHVDPVAQSSVSLDQTLLDWGADPAKLSELSGSTPLMEGGDQATQIRTVLRRLYLIGDGRPETVLEDPWFVEFLGALTYLKQKQEVAVNDTDLRDHVSALLETVTESLRGWSGSVADSNYIEFVDGIKSTDYRFLSRWSRPGPNNGESHEQTREETTPGQLWLVLVPEGTDDSVPVPVTFELYELMKQIRRGYNPNALDLERSEGMRLIHSRLSEFTNKQELVRVVNKLDDELFSVERGGFNTLDVKRGGLK